MCGGNGTDRLINQIIRGTSHTQVGHRPQGAGGSPPSGTIREIQCMYARGQIDADTFRRLLDVTAATGSGVSVSGPPIPADRRLKATVNAPPVTDDLAAQTLLRQLETERLQLQAAFNETYQAIRRLEAEAYRLREQAGEAAMSARSCPEDEAHRRACLDEEQRALEQAAAVEERLTVIQNSLQWLGAQLDGLAVRKASLSA